MQQITILGATGSIGKSTLSVLEQNPGRFSVYALTAKQNGTLLAEQCIRFQPKYAVIEDDAAAAALALNLKNNGCSTEVLCGLENLALVASADDVDIVMAAIVGAAGLRPTLAAVQAGKRVLLANKESLVMSGGLFQQEVRASGAKLLPVDSEHNAIFQCLPEKFSSLKSAGVTKLLLTGSGGPFRTTELAALEGVTPDQACAHPNWSMGRKISVDSATMMNKGLEFIEACWLFNASSEDIDIVVHPQSIVHSMVQYADGSVLAQMGQPDMCTPIANCLGWPERIDAGVKPLDFHSMTSLTFEAPNFERFACLRLAIDAFDAGKDFSVALNAANEIAVDLFLQERIKFTDISRLIAILLEKWESVEPDSIDAVIEADVKARQETHRLAKLL